MRVGVVGAGIAGVTTAFELAEAGHEVTVYERCDAVAEAASFAHAGLLTAGLVSPAAAPGLRRWLLRGLRHHESALRWRPGLDPAHYQWLWQWWRASSSGHAGDVRAMTELAVISLQRLDQLTRDLGLSHERSRGVLVLLRDSRELAPTHRHAGMLRELGWAVNELTPQACLEIEPHLGRSRLAGGLHLPDDGVGNCRQMTQQLRDHAERRQGVQFTFGTEVGAIRTEGRQITLQLRARERDAAAPSRPGPVLRSRASAAHPPDTAEADFVPTQPLDRDRQATHDAVVLCSGADTTLVHRHAQALPIQPVWGHAATFRIHPDGQALQSAVVDASAGVTLSRLGPRLRVTGGFELGGSPGPAGEAALSPLYAALDHWFPHATERRQAQIWRGARPMLPHGPPVIGPSATPGVWLNLGHGAHGWTLACGSARLLAEQISGRPCSTDPAPFAASRWAHP